jgi:hypothetical protein
MKLLKGIGIGLCLTVLCLLAAPGANASEQDSKTVVTFSLPVEVPGVSAQILPAGIYIVEALDSSPDRDIIQITSQDGTHVFTTFLGIPNSRLKAPDMITVMFTDRPDADPLALKAWYCPGRIWGDQIVYEKSRAIKLAKESNETVLSTPIVLAISSVEVLKTAPIEAVDPAGETVAIAQVVDAPPVVTPALPEAAAPAVVVASGVTSEPKVEVAASPAPEPAAPIDPAAPVAPTAPAEPAVTTAPTATLESPVAEARVPAPATTAVTEPTVAPAPIAASAPIALTNPAAAAEPAVAASPEVAMETLPKTASRLPLIGLVGLLVLGASFLLASLMKRNTQIN